MSSESYKLYAGWRPRQESTRACAVRLAGMLEGLARAHPALARWNKKAWTRAAANEPAWAMPPDIDELTAVFERGRRYKDVPREPWPEQGYFVYAWNGRDRPYDASFEVWSGGYSTNMAFPNSVDLSMNPASAGNADLTSVAVLRPVMLSVVAAWEPAYGSLVCWDYWQRLFGDRRYPLFRSGWMTYLAPQYASGMTAPPEAIVESVPGGGQLLLATEERFSMENPEHLAVADAIQQALDPLQETVDIGRP